MRSGAVLLVVAALALSACSAEASADESATTSASASATVSATPTPTPSASPAPLQPTSPVAGGCDGLAAAPGVDGVVGQVQRVTAPRDLWRVGIETAGGLTCSLLTTKLAADAYVIPDALVVGDVAKITETPDCETGARAMECWASVSGNGHVTLVVGSFSPSADTDASLALVGELAGVFSAVASDGAAVRSQKTTWAHPLDCTAMAQIIGLTSILGSDEAHTSLVRPPARTVEARLSEASTTSSRCDWERTPTQKGDLGSSYSIIAVPDGAWAWKQVASRVPDSVDATVGGHPARVTSTGDVYLSDGVNILHLTGQRLAGVSVVDTSLGVLSVLSASAGQTRG